MTCYEPAPANVPGSHQAAAQSLVDRGTADSIALSARQLKTNREGSSPEILEFASAFLKDLQARGMPFFAHCFFRSGEEQNNLFHSGVTKARQFESPHNWGMAVDIVHFGQYWNLTKKQWAVVGLLGKETARRRNIKITWGGDWSFYDPAHWELSDWKARIKDLRADNQVPLTFQQAFAQARLDGVATFLWNGRRYTTEVA